MGDDLSTMAVEDTARAEMIVLPIVFVLGLFIFGSLTAALLPSMVGAIAMTLALAALRLVTDHTNVATHAMIVVSLLGMGLAIDYTLFVVTRFREELGTGRGREPAVAAMGPTMATAGRTVVVSGVIVAVSLAGLFVFPLTGIRSLAWGAIPAVLGAMAAAVTLLPAVLAVLSHRVNSLRLPWTRRHSMVGREADSRGFWARVAHHVMARPWTYLILTTAALLACATPFLGSRWGGADEAQLPLDAPSRVALQTEAKHFGGDRTWGYVMVEGGTPADAAPWPSTSWR
ncbi:MMPL family transporter [Actinomycetota bacterium]